MFARLPVTLPRECIKGYYKNPRCRFFGLHWDLRNQRLLCQDRHTIAICPDSWAFIALTTLNEKTQIFLDSHHVELLTGRFWLIHDNEANITYAADRALAIQCIQQQSLPKEANDESGRYSKRETA